MRRKGRNRLSAYTDDRYEIHWGKFRYLLKQQDSRALAHVPIFYGSRPPAEDSVWNRIRDDGFDRHWQLPAFESQQILMRPKTIAPAFIADFGP